jgi:hypothetical protein
MLVRRDGEEALVIGQLSHAWVSGQIARAWGNGLFPPPDPHEEIALGAEQHDIGWARFDLEPKLNLETGLPRNFLELTVEEHLSIWRDAPDRLMSQSMHAALVVSLHGRSLSELRARAAPEDSALLHEHVRQERTRQAALCELLEVSDDMLERTRRQMWTWDGISLALCNHWRPFVSKDVPSHDGLIDVEMRDRADGSVELDPWPLSHQRVTVRCEARRIAAHYGDERAMRRALERSPATLTFELVDPGCRPE